MEGLPRSRARQRLVDAGFRVRERREESSTIAENRVIRTQPSIGALAEVGGPVTMIASGGPEQVKVPEVVGQQLDEARDELERAGLTADVTREESADDEPGTVLRQSPGAGKSVEEGTSITLVVAEEPEEVDVPDVVGRDESEAVAALSSVGLEVNVEETEVTRPSQDGVVQRQSPRSGQRLSPGRRVSITVGRFEPDLDPDGGGGDSGGADGGTETQPSDEGTTTGASFETGADG